MRFWVVLLLLLAAAGVALPASAMVVLGQPDSGVVLKGGAALLAGASAARKMRGVTTESSLSLSFPTASSDLAVYNPMPGSAANDDPFGLAGDPLTENAGSRIVTLIGLGGPVSAAPEPGVWFMLMAGFGLIGLTLRRRRANPSLGHAQII